MNYGHQLEFGTFLTPSASAPEDIVALAKRSEDLGFDLVTYQDHPYQPAFLDTWTLMSWVAGQTERIRIAANVLNLPLRSPAVLARAAASLDLLSSGRFELSLGAGAYWAAIEAMGGRRLEPGPSVDALSEAIDLIRGLWDAGERRGLRYDGDYYRVAGAQRGPLPAHEIPIWIGANKPRMLRLIGRKADGWLATIGYLQPGEFQAANQTIDEAALRAGRDPGEIRRLVNISGRFSDVPGGFLDGPSEQWVRDLLPLVLEDGVGTFILMSDDAATLELFASEVIPALRKAVVHALPSLARTPKLRRAREGHDW